MEMPERMYKSRCKQVANARLVAPLAAHVADGGWLEFRHSDGNWRLVNDSNLTEVAMSPHRYRKIEQLLTP
jgi:hypothetical protein